MTSLANDAVQPRPRRGLRGITIAVVTAGAVALPASPALADHMPGMNGTMCPHASGEGPNALGAAGPDEGAAPAQAPSSGPIAGVSAPRASTPTPAAPADPGLPATEVTQAATQVQYQQPATVAASVQAESATTAVTVAAPRLTRAERLRLRRERAEARRAQRQARIAERSYVHTSAVEPFSLERMPIAVAARPLPADPAPGAGLLWALLALVPAAALAAGLLARRRDSGDGVAADERPGAPIAPSYADAAIEAELHEMIAEARARELLATHEESETAAPG